MEYNGVKLKSRGRFNVCQGCHFFVNNIGYDKCKEFNYKEFKNPHACDERIIIYVKDEQPYQVNDRPSKTQIGGDHYKNMAIQPTEFCQKNELNWCESNVIKYVCRHRNKNGLQDLEKAKHYIDLLIEFEYNQKAKNE